MEFLEFKIWKAVAIVVAVGLACFFYRLFTGKDLRDKFRKHPDQS